MTYQELQKYIGSCREAYELIPADRKHLLYALADYIRTGLTNDAVSITFICTHNSRRSHLGQVWLKVACEAAGLHNIRTYSGGTEATACNPRTVAALVRAGFDCHDSGGTNPDYLLRYDEEKEPITCFSKRFDDPVNPKADFAAVMTCSDADENCPFIPGAELRLPVTYEDPKASDGTPGESETYDARCRQVAREMLFVADAVQRTNGFLMPQ